jgi:hypothetical protein
MPWQFDTVREFQRDAVGSRRNRFAAIQFLCGALVIALATAANPSIGETPAADDGSYGANEASLTTGASLQQFAHADLRRILGKEVRSPSDQAMGRIVDLLVDETGQPRAAIIDFGGFLGLGARKIAIDWSTLRFDTTRPKEAVVVALDRDEIKAAPEYKDSRDVVAVVTSPPSRRDNIPYP